MACHNRPEYRFALGGLHSPNREGAAERLLAGIYLDWLAVTRHSADVDAACRRAREEQAELSRSADAQSGPQLQERAGLRRSFKAGELSQRDYQARLKEPGRLLERIEWDRRAAERGVQLRFTAWAEGFCGRALTLEEAERLLAEPALVVPARLDDSSC
jgi:hypothetical protein